MRINCNLIFVGKKESWILIESWKLFLIIFNCFIENLKIVLYKD